MQEVAVVHAEERFRPRKLLSADTVELQFENLRWPYILAIPILAITGCYVDVKKRIFDRIGRKLETNVWFVDGASINSRRVKDGSARWPALDTVYNFHAGEGATPILRTVDAYWMHIRNAQAVRNRLKIVKREVRKAILRAAISKSGEVKLLSLAAGSAQGVLEVAYELARENIRVDIVLVDQDASALAYASALAEKMGLRSVRAIQGNVLKFESSIGNFTPDIIEMCGLMDYLSPGIASLLVRRIHKRLKDGGQFLTCHVHPNTESYFLDKVVNWGMIYRSLPQFMEILEAGDFFEINMFTEPQGIHSVAVAEKSAV